MPTVPYVAEAASQGTAADVLSVPAAEPKSKLKELATKVQQDVKQPVKSSNQAILDDLKVTTSQS